MGEELGNYVHQNRSRVFSTSSFGQKILRSRVFSAQISGLRKNSQILGLFYRSRVFSAQISGHRKILRSRVFFYRSRVFSAQISGLRKNSHISGLFLKISGLFCADLGSALFLPSLFFRCDHVAGDARCGRSDERFVPLIGDAHWQIPTRFFNLI